MDYETSKTAYEVTPNQSSIKDVAISPDGHIIAFQSLVCKLIHCRFCVLNDDITNCHTWRCFYN